MRSPWPALVLMGCAPGHDFSFQPPPDVRWVGVLRGDAPSDAEPPGLVPITEGAVEVALGPDEGAPWHVVGYRDADLAGLTLPGAAIMSSTPLEPVTPEACWSLGVPTWSVAVTAAAQAAATPTPSAPWARQCPATGARAYDLRCTNPYLLCGVEVTRDGCVDTFDTTACPAATPRVALEAGGLACALPRSTGDCERTTRADGGPRWVCGPCTLDAYEPTPPPAPELRIARVAPPIASEGLFRGTRLLPRQIAVGRARVLGVRDDVVLAATVEAEARLTGTCASSRWLRLDPDTLEVVSSRDDTVCPSVLMPDPRGPGFLAAAYAGRSLQVGRVDAGGRWTMRVPTSTLPADREVYPGEVVMVAIGASLYVSEALHLIGATGSNLHTLDLDTLTALRPARWVPDVITGLAATTSGSLVITQSDGLNVIAADSASVPAAVQLFSSSEFYEPHVVSPRRLLIVDPGAARGVVAVDVQGPTPAYLQTARPFEARGLVTSFEPRTAGVAWAALVLSVADGRDWNAALAQIDLSEDVRVLPGVLPLERDGAPIVGPLIDLTNDGRGRTWGLATWAGLVVRISREP